MVASLELASWQGQFRLWLRLYLLWIMFRNLSIMDSTRLSAATLVLSCSSRTEHCRPAIPLRIKCMQSKKHLIPVLLCLSCNPSCPTVMVSCEKKHHMSERGVELAAVTKRKDQNGPEVPKG